MSLRRPANQRLLTPDDTASGESDGPDYQPSHPVRGLQQRRVMWRTVARVENERRVTPEDHGGQEQPTGLITIRKLRNSDGVEVWNGRRGEASDVVDDPDVGGQPHLIPAQSCRAILLRDDGNLLTVGNAIDRLPHWGNVISWTPSGLQQRRSSDGGEFDAAVGWHLPGTTASSYGRHYAVESNGLVWTAGSVPNGAPARRAIQAYDPTTLASEFVVEMPDIPNDDGDDDHYWTHIADSPNGIVAHRAGELPVLPGQVDTEGGRFERIDADGSHVASLSWWREGTFATGISASIGGAVATYGWVSDYALGRDGRVYLIALKRTGVGPNAHATLIVTDTSLAVATTTYVESPHSYLPDAAWDYTDGSYISAPNPVDASFPFQDWPFRLLVDDEAVYVLTQTEVGHSPPSSPNFGSVVGATRSAIIFQFDVDGTFTSSYLVRGTATVDPVLDFAGNLFYVFSYLGTQYLVKLTSGVEQWEVALGTSITQFRSAVTSGGYHYITTSGATGSEVRKFDAATGALQWTGRHDEPLLDVLVSGDYVYVVGEGSTYEP